MNTYVIENGYAKLIILDKKQQKNVVLIDIEDVERCKQIQWSITKRGYVKSQKGGSLHRFVMTYNGPLDIDHINRNKLDNRKSNLRIVDKFTNNQNNDRDGVFFDKHANKWRVEFHRYGKYFYAGIFPSREEAILARQKLVDEIDSERDKHLADYESKKSNKHTGVRPSPHGKWLARFCADNKTYYVGTYDTEEEAIVERRKAIEEHTKAKATA